MIRLPRPHHHLSPGRNHMKSHWEAANAPAYQGDHCARLVSPRTSLNISWDPCCTWALAPLCLFVYFWKLKLGHIVWQVQVSRWRRRKEYLTLWLSQNSTKGGPLSSACLTAGLCTDYFSVTGQQGAFFSSPQPPFCPPGAKSLLISLSLPLPWTSFSCSLALWPWCSHIHGILWIICNFPSLS